MRLRVRKSSLSVRAQVAFVLFPVANIVVSGIAVAIVLGFASTVSRAASLLPAAMPPSLVIAAALAWLVAGRIVPSSRPVLRVIRGGRRVEEDVRRPVARGPLRVVAGR
jgi:hypothetical protein